MEPATVESSIQCAMGCATLPDILISKALLMEILKLLII